MEYLDFDLEVTAADGGACTVRVLRSPAGEATGTMRGNRVEPTWR